MRRFLLGLKSLESGQLGLEGGGFGLGGGEGFAEGGDFEEVRVELVTAVFV